MFSVRGDGQVESSGGIVLIGRKVVAGPPKAPSSSSASVISGDADQTGALASSGSGEGAPVEPNVVLTVFERSGTGACTLCACFIRHLLPSVCSKSGALILSRITRSDRAAIQ